MNDRDRLDCLRPSSQRAPGRRATRSPTPAILAAVRTMVIDAGTATIIRAMDARRLPCILLKGPAIARRIYTRPTDRSYTDIDLLVAPDDHAPAKEELTRLGFQDALEGTWRHEQPAHARLWTRQDPTGEVQVDLHTTVWGVGAPPATVWRVLAAARQPLPVGGATAWVVSLEAQALLIALHAAQHGRQAKPLADLDQAACRLPEATWHAAARLADALDARVGFGAGLGLTTAGRALAERLAVGDSAAHRRVRELSSAPGPVQRLDQLGQLPGWWGKLWFALGVAVPSPVHMRSGYPLAKRGVWGLCAAYLWRVACLAARVPWDLGQLWRLRRSAGPR